VRNVVDIGEGAGNQDILLPGLWKNSWNVKEFGGHGDGYERCRVEVARWSQSVLMLVGKGINFD
jgi:hypothetical protein